MKIIINETKLRPSQQKLKLGDEPAKVKVKYIKDKLNKVKFLFFCVNNVNQQRDDYVEKQEFCIVCISKILLHLLDHALV